MLLFLKLFKDLDNESQVKREDIKYIIQKMDDYKYLSKQV